MNLADWEDSTTRQWKSRQKGYILTYVPCWWTPTTASQTGSDYTFWKGGKISHQLFSNFTSVWALSWTLGLMYYIMLEVKCYAGMLIVLLNESSVNRSFSNSMGGIDRLWYRSEVVFLSSFHAITTFVRHINWRSKNNNDFVKMSKHAVQQN